jgi:hypothetical protein
MKRKIIGRLSQVVVRPQLFREAIPTEKILEATQRTRPTKMLLGRETGTIISKVVSFQVLAT